MGIAPGTGSILADHDVERRRSQRYDLGICLDEREEATELPLSLPRCRELLRRLIKPHRPRPSESQPIRDVRRPAPEVEHVLAVQSFGQHAQRGLRNAPDPQNGSSDPQAMAPARSYSEDFRSHAIRLRAT